MRSFLKGFLAGFRRLQWRLTFSYILITAVALLVTLAVAILILAQFVINQYSQNASSALHDQAPFVLMQLIKHQGLNDDVSWIDESIAVNYNDPNTEVIAVISTQGGYTVLINPDGQVLASSDTDAMPEGGSLFTKLPLDGI